MKVIVAILVLLTLGAVILYALYWNLDQDIYVIRS
jgi:hypothetical protein